MKIRCVENSIRLRVKKSEIALLKENGRISEAVVFPNGQTFNYGLSIAPQLTSVTPSYIENNIEIQLPQNIADNWINSNEVGIEVNIPIDQEKKLHLLIEKDFPCLDRPNEDKSDTFFELVPDKPDNC